MKDHEDLCCALSFSVYENNKGAKGAYWGRYYKLWKEDTSMNAINSFVKRFLEDAEFRKEWHRDGKEFESTISFAEDSV